MKAVKNLEARVAHLEKAVQAMAEILRNVVRNMAAPADADEISRLLSTFEDKEI